MKIRRFLCILTALALLLSLAGCRAAEEEEEISGFRDLWPQLDEMDGASLYPGSEGIPFPEESLPGLLEQLSLFDLSACVCDRGARQFRADRRSEKEGRLFELRLSCGEEKRVQITFISPWLAYINGDRITGIDYDTFCSLCAYIEDALPWEGFESANCWGDFTLYYAADEAREIKAAREALTAAEQNAAE